MDMCEAKVEGLKINQHLQVCEPRVGDGIAGEIEVSQRLSAATCLSAPSPIWLSASSIDRNFESCSSSASPGPLSCVSRRDSAMRFPRGRRCASAGVARRSAVEAKRLEVRQIPQMHKPGGGDVGISQEKRLQTGQRAELGKIVIGDVRIAETQFTEMLQLGQMPELHGPYKCA